MNPADLSQQSFSGLNQQANSIEKAVVIAAALQTCLDFNYPIYESALSVPCPRDDTVAILGAISSLKKSGKIEGYVDEVIPRYSDVDSKSHFRLSRCTIQILMEKLPHRQEATTGRPSLYISRPDVVVLMSLWTLGTQESFREVADRFGLGKVHAYRAFTAFCGDLCSLRGEIICWPQGETAFKSIRDFSSLRELSFPDVISCVDGAHISMSAPKDEKTAYFNRKQYTSMLLQGVCDADMKFIDVFAGWPGSSHDARVWNNSPLLCAIQANPALIPEGAHILGDCAYPLSR